MLKTQSKQGELMLGMKDVRVTTSIENICGECQRNFISKLRAYGTNVFFRLDDEE